ncbi:uncharacterized protein EI90DRAFT_3288815 [Cantharellus anzutake]|uniref:uncharacterized protein n=1 Tax=Cantharellus anzutake TaxID=1750568 RepID=UPI0019066E98|nr:uncharacterized protein EI90DRAFT_3295517 [Cantharellus anzutake]XP_038917405.1 uncharacterized protein EI90DRAFT_3288815 [Cantharellus anzutake]KAF8311112.1 hypothetical protein EI90DRAFT_3295517 [Cantharellus anzutake]KAF8333252.1 hypothetical protein EI90DRAFT_3288815 [Cantharellus anzutake]
MVPVAKAKEKDVTKQEFNARIMQLKANFEVQVSAIALEFSRRGHHYSQRQIRNQVIYKLSKPKKTRKPTMPNAWAHAQAEAERLKGKELTYMSKRGVCLRSTLEGALPNLPYKEEYLKVLEDINGGKLAYEDVQKPMTSEEEYTSQVILDGVMVKRHNRALKETIISPELSMNSIAIHARDQLLSISCGVEVLVLMTRGHSEDLFAPVVWGTDKAKAFWAAVAHVDMGVQIRLMEAHVVGKLETMVQGYNATAAAMREEIAKVTRISLRGKLIEPKLARADHMREVLKGWKDGQIKWVELTEDQVEKRREELAALTAIVNPNETARSIATDGEDEENNIGSANIPSGSAAPAVTPSPLQPNATQAPIVTSGKAATATRGRKRKAPQNSNPRKKKQPASAVAC